MNSLSLIIAPLIALQSVGQTPTAIENENPETWTLEYPRLIQPFLADYRRCLSTQMRRVSGEADFEAQARNDLPRCETVRIESEAEAVAILEGREQSSDFSADDVREVFAHAGRIHVARGADLDQQFTFIFRRTEAMQEQYDREKPRGLVLELHDASVVKARTDATAQAAEAAHRAREAERAQNAEEARGAQD